MPCSPVGRSSPEDTWPVGNMTLSESSGIWNQLKVTLVTSILRFLHATCIVWVPKAGSFSWKMSLIASSTRSWKKDFWILLMEEILHQLIDILSRYLQGFIHPWWLFGISSINSTRKGNNPQSLVHKQVPRHSKSQQSKVIYRFHCKPMGKKSQQFLATINQDLFCQVRFDK